VSTLIGLAIAVIAVLQLVLLARVVSSWVVVLAGPGGRHPGLQRIDAALARVSDPVLAPVRRVLPPLRLGSVALDLAVPVVLVALGFLRALLSGL
jgi:YggT family protein